MKHISNLPFSDLIRTKEAQEITELWRIGVESNIMALKFGCSTYRINKILRKLALVG